jgi:hypothetical protein
MSWSKVSNNHSKPLKWWYHKIMCEIAYYIYTSAKRYYYHVDKCCEIGFNLYGEKI